MSAKGRAPKTAETGAEFFPTPTDAITPLLESPLVLLPGGRWIEPCAGTGAIVRTVNAARADVRWTLCEIDPRVGEYLHPLLRPGDELLELGDFITRPWAMPTADVLIMNPPFSLALEFAMEALERARVVVMLQRNSWFGTKGRAHWLRTRCPDMLTLPARPSFTPDGKTDSSEYSWFLWPEGGHSRRAGRIAMLDGPRGQGALFG